MSTFLFIYRSPRDYVSGSDDALTAWGAFFKGIGSNIADVGNPVFERRELGNCGADTVLGGYSVVRAENLAEAVALAEGCPALQRAGGVEVGEITQLDASSLRPREDHVQATSSAQ